MKRDPSALSNIDRIDKRKQNRTRRVKIPPQNAEPGDTIIMDDDVLIFDDDNWTNITKPVARQDCNT